MGIECTLPRNWTGRCALVEPVNTILIVGGQPKLSRTKRELTDRSKTPAISRSNPVPKSIDYGQDGKNFGNQLFQILGYLIYKLKLKLPDMN